MFWKYEDQAKPNNDNISINISNSNITATTIRNVQFLLFHPMISSAVKIKRSSRNVKQKQNVSATLQSCSKMTNENEDSSDSHYSSTSVASFFPKSVVSSGELFDRLAICARFFHSLLFLTRLFSSIFASYSVERLPCSRPCFPRWWYGSHLHVLAAASFFNLESPLFYFDDDFGCSIRNTASIVTQIYFTKN